MFDVEIEISIVDAPATFKLFVWQHFGYLVETINSDRLIDKTRTICKNCKKIVLYTADNTSTMQRHLQKILKQVYGPFNFIVTEEVGLQLSNIFRIEYSTDYPID